MRARLLIISTIFPLIFSCNINHKDENSKKKKEKDAINVEQQIKENDVSSLTIASLQGVWAENKDDNALFYIFNDTLTYVENQDISIEIKLKGDTLQMKGDIPVNCKIIKLNSDSLVFIDEFSEMPTRLYKRK